MFELAYIVFVAWIEQAQGPCPLTDPPDGRAGQMPDYAIFCSGD